MRYKMGNDPNDLVYTCDRCGCISYSSSILIGTGEYSFNNLCCYRCYSVFDDMYWDPEDLMPVSEGRQRVKLTKEDIENIVL